MIDIQIAMSDLWEAFKKYRSVSPYPVRKNTILELIYKTIEEIEKATPKEVKTK